MTKLRQVACPVALHPDGAPLRIPVLKHPAERYQLVKGGIEAGEAPERAAARELFEESGLETRSAIFLAASQDLYPGEIWHFSLCRVAPPVRDRWQHFCKDDGGHLLQYHWHGLNDPPPQQMHPTFVAALEFIRSLL